MKQVYLVYIWDESKQKYCPLAVLSSEEEAIKLILAEWSDVLGIEEAQEVKRDLQKTGACDKFGWIEAYYLLDKFEQHYYDTTLLDKIK